MLLFLFFSCSSLPPYTYPSQTLEIQHQGTTLNLTIENGFITNLHNTQAGNTLDYGEYWIAPAFIDSHVHLAYLAVAPALLDGGVAAAIDLASPSSFLALDLSPLQLRKTGPMITALQGYPTQSWGSNGYGIQCNDVQCVESSIQDLHSKGSRITKIPLTSSPTLSDAQILTAIQTSNALNIPVVAHALSNAQAQRAGELGVNVLAHTPTEACTIETLQLWSKKTIISTLHAFGSTHAISNLSQVHSMGGQILYGTDLGNAQEIGISLSELQKLQQAGLSEEEIMLSGTKNPASFWGFSDLGAIDVGFRASFLILDSNPYVDITTLSRPVEVWIDGQKR